MSGYKSIQIIESQWYSLGHYDKTECCDCGLVHREEFKLEEGRIWWRTRRDERSTRAARKARGSGPPPKGKA